MIVGLDWLRLKQAKRHTAIMQDGVIRFVHPAVEYSPSNKMEDVEANHDYELLDAAIATLLAEKPVK